MLIYRQRIEQEELDRVMEACDMVFWIIILYIHVHVSLRKDFNTTLHLYMPSQALELNEKKLKILSYVESRMSFIAPNLSSILGPTVATKLMGEEQKILCTCTVCCYRCISSSLPFLDTGLCFYTANPASFTTYICILV